MQKLRAHSARARGCSKCYAVLQNPSAHVPGSPPIGEFQWLIGKAFSPPSSPATRNTVLEQQLYPKGGVIPSTDSLLET